MDFAQIAELADLFAAAAVFGSLVFVFIELRRSNDESQLSNWLAFTGRRFEHMAIAREPEMAGIILRGRNGMTNLSKEETLIFTRYLIQCQLSAQSFQRLVDRGKDSHADAIYASKMILLDDWDHPGPREWWESVRQAPPVVPFAANFVDDVLGYPKIERKNVD